MQICRYSSYIKETWHLICCSRVFFCYKSSICHRRRHNNEDMDIKWNCPYIGFQIINQAVAKYLFTMSLWWCSFVWLRCWNGLCACPVYCFFFSIILCVREMHEMIGHMRWNTKPSFPKDFTLFVLFFINFCSSSIFVFQKGSRTVVYTLTFRIHQPYPTWPKCNYFCHAQSSFNLSFQINCATRK